MRINFDRISQNSALSSTRIVKVVDLDRQTAPDESLDISLPLALEDTSYGSPHKLLNMSLEMDDRQAHSTAEQFHSQSRLPEGAVQIINKVLLQKGRQGVSTGEEIRQKNRPFPDEPLTELVHRMFRKGQPKKIIEPRKLIPMKIHARHEPCRLSHQKRQELDELMMTARARKKNNSSMNSNSSNGVFNRLYLLSEKKRLEQTYKQQTLNKKLIPKKHSGEQNEFLKKFVAKVQRQLLEKAERHQRLENLFNNVDAKTGQMLFRPNRSASVTSHISLFRKNLHMTAKINQRLNATFDNSLLPPRPNNQEQDLSQKNSPQKTLTTTGYETRKARLMSRRRDKIIESFSAFFFARRVNQESFFTFPENPSRLFTNQEYHVLEPFLNDVFIRSATTKVNEQTFQALLAQFIKSLPIYQRSLIETCSDRTSAVKARTGRLHHPEIDMKSRSLERSRSYHTRQLFFV